MMTLPPIEVHVMEPHPDWRQIDQATRFTPLEKAFYRGAACGAIVTLSVLAVVWAACKIGGLL